MKCIRGGFSMIQYLVAWSIKNLKMILFLQLQLLMWRIKKIAFYLFKNGIFAYLRFTFSKWFENPVYFFFWVYGDLRDFNLIVVTKCFCCIFEKIMLGQMVVPWCWDVTCFSLNWVMVTGVFLFLLVVGWRTRLNESFFLFWFC